MRWFKDNWIVVTVAVFFSGVGGWIALAEDGHDEREQRIERIEKFVDIEIEKQKGRKAVEEYRRKLCREGKLKPKDCEE